jgi:hypothetical protein
MTQTLSDVTEVQTVNVESWHDNEHLNRLLAEGWTIMQTAAGTVQETGDSYFRVLLGRSRGAA